MTKTEIINFVKEWFDTLNEKDFVRLRSFYADDVVQFEAPTRTTKVGYGFIAERLKSLTGSSCDFHSEINNILVDDNTAIVLFTDSGTNTERFLGHKSTKTHYKFDSCIIFEFENKKIAKHTTFLDVATVFRAMGIAKLPNSYGKAA